MQQTKLSFDETVNLYQSRVEHHLHQILKHPPEIVHLNAAMRYSVLNAGKRLRPMLVYATGETLDLPLDRLDTAACAVELIHCYSLIHDDLPAMDDDDLRRGQPSCHCAFSEATAILAGDAMQSLAFAVLTAPQSDLSPAQRLAMCHHLATACGMAGMAGGQAMDLDATGKTLSIDTLQTMHQRKTGALLAACVELACIAAQPATEQQHALRQFAHHFGLAFQIQDDILDIEVPSDTLGKPQHSDSSKGKATYPQLLGMAKAKQACETHFAAARAHLAAFKDSPLWQLLDLTESRNF